ncbi:hypothetical protein KSP39_PZI010265 [Platanthera zijinensis]|uniref:Uncharacterized protein n=1 Tax=Platanthera zijinensis TaxID=2320716 RepID=A0AAP0G6B9_9ASPA
MLLNPMLPTFYGCNKNQIPQLEEITSIKLMVLKGCPMCYFDNGYNKSCGSATCQHGIKKAKVIEWNPKSTKIMADADKAFVVGSKKARSLLGAMLIFKSFLTDIFSAKPTRKRKSL